MMVAASVPRTKRMTITLPQASRFRAGWWHNAYYNVLLTGVHGEQKMVSRTYNNKLGILWGNIATESTGNCLNLWT